MYLISSHSNQSCPQEHSPELIREEGETHGQRKQPEMGERGTENISKGPFKNTLVYSMSLQNMSFFRKLCVLTGGFQCRQLTKEDLTVPMFP